MAFDFKKALRIIVIEDETTSRAVIKRFLSKSAIAVSDMKFAASLADAYKLMDENYFDIALVDLNLQDSKGLDTLVNINKKCPSVAKIVITGAYNEDDGLEAIANDAQEYLVKGDYTVRSLTKAIYYAIERKQAECKQAELVEQIKSVNQELKSITNLISHDMEAQFQSIGILINSLTTDYFDRLDADAKEQINLLSNQIDSMHNLVEGILQYSSDPLVKKTF